MNIAIDFLDFIFSYFLDHSNLYIILFLIIPVIIQVILKLTKREKIAFVLAIFVGFFTYSLSYFLYRLKIIDLYLFAFITISFVLEQILTSNYSHYDYRKNFLKIGGIYIKKMNLYKLYGCFVGIYALFAIKFFNELPIVKYSLSFIYLVSFIYEVINIKVHNKYIGSFEDSASGMEIVEKYNGNIVPILPIPLLLNVKVYWFFTLIGIAMGIEKAKLNRGVFDISNRSSLIVFNTDNQWQGALFLISATFLISSSFSLQSVFYVVLLISLWKLIRFAGQSIPKYYTSITGEIFSNRPNIYDNLLLRVIPDNKVGFISKTRITKKTYSYAVFFNNFQYSYDSSKGIVSNSEIVKNTYHSILIFNRSNQKINFICENDLHLSLKSPMTIIDSWAGSIYLTDYFKDIQSDYEWLNARLSLLQRITDEIYGNVDGGIASHVKTESEKVHAENTLLRMNLVNSSSFESLRQNIRLLEEYFSDYDHKNLKNIYGNGIFEFNTLYRQLHESPSIPSRFIDLLNISECIIRYLCGFCFATRIKDEMVINLGLNFDTKAIAFGTCQNYLAQWKKIDNENISILSTKIIDYLDTPYMDEKNVEDLVYFLKIINPSIKGFRKPLIIDLFKALVEVRNKTRGHGTPSKVDYQFYVCLEKVTLFLLSEMSKLNFEIAIRTKLDNQEWTVDLSKGGLPVIVPVVSKLEKIIHLNPMLNESEFEKYKIRHSEILENIPQNDDELYLKVSQDNQTEWWKCKDYFMVKNGIVYILNQRTDSKESWISFSTGKIMRPEISEF